MTGEGPQKNPTNTHTHDAASRPGQVEETVCASAETRTRCAPCPLPSPGEVKSTSENIDVELCVVAKRGEGHDKCHKGAYVTTSANTTELETGAGKPLGPSEGVGENYVAINGGIVCRNTCVDVPGADHTTVPGHGGPSPTTLGGIECSPSNSHHPKRDETVTADRQSAGCQNGHSLVDFGVSVRGSGTIVFTPVVGEDAPTDLEYLQVGQVRQTGCIKVPPNSSDPSKVAEGHGIMGFLWSSTLCAEGGIQSPLNPFHPPGCSDIPSGPRSIDGGDRTSHSAHPTVGHTCGGEAVRGPDALPARGTSANPNVGDVGNSSLSWTLPSRKIDCEDLSGRVEITKDETKNGCVLQHLSHWERGNDWSLRQVQYTSEDWRVLLSEIQDEIELDVVMFSSGAKNSIRIRVDDGAFVKVAEPRKPCSLPLALVSVNRINFDNLLSLPQTPTEELVDLLKWIHTDRAFTEATTNPKFQEVRMRLQHHVSRYLLSDVPSLMMQGIFEEKPFTDFSLEIPLFKVPKSGLVDARLIGDCRPLNELLPRPGNMALPNVSDVLLCLLGKFWLHQEDARSYFYQFDIHPSLSELLSSRVGGKRGHFTQVRWMVMPMGFSFAPAIAQHVSLHICKNVNTKGDLVLIPWVDNFLFGTDTMTEMQGLIQRFTKVAHEINLDMKPADYVPSQTMDCLGLTLDVTGATKNEHFASLSQAYKENLRHLKGTLNVVMSPRELYQVYGSLMWANYAIIRAPLAKWPHALELIRSCGRNLHGRDRDSWDERIEISGTVTDELHQMIDEALIARVYYNSLVKQQPSCKIWTDASSLGAGWVREDKHGHLVAGQQLPDMFIFVSELMAAADAFLSEPVGAQIAIDNTAAQRALIRGHSSTAAGNVVMKRLYEQLPAGCRSEVLRVPSGCNRADALSRGKVRIPVFTQPCPHETAPVDVRWRK